MCILLIFTVYNCLYWTLSITHEDPLISADISIITRDPLSLVHSTSNMLECVMEQTVLLNIRSVSTFKLRWSSFWGEIASTNMPDRARWVHKGPLSQSQILVWASRDTVDPGLGSRDSDENTTSKPWHWAPVCAMWTALTLLRGTGRVFLIPRY